MAFGTRSSLQRPVFFYMHGLDFSLQQNMGDEAVGAVEEDCFVNVLVLHKGIIAEMINNTPSLIASFTKLC